MISETTHSQKYNSFWRIATPTSELFVRRINSHLYERRFPPLKSSIRPERRGLINETAFVAFCTLVEDSSFLRSFDLTEAILSASLKEASSQLDVYEPCLNSALNADEKADLRTQYARLVEFFRPLLNARKITAKPFFPGCGIVDGCYGDLCTASELFEIKAGDRTFRSSDLRQLIIYLSLKKQKTNVTFSHVSLFNPRAGISFRCSTEDLCFEMSGRQARDLLSEVIESFSGNGISR